MRRCPLRVRAAGGDEFGTPAEDGRVHGGPLSYTALPSGWSQPYATRRFFFGRDSCVQTQRMNEGLPWPASAQVGVVRTEVFPGGYPGGPATALAMLDCLLDSDFHTSVEVRTGQPDVGRIRVGDVPATRRDVLLSLRHPQLRTTGSRIRIIVVDSEPVTYYFHAVPKERHGPIEELDGATRSLRVDA